MRAVESKGTLSGAATALVAAGLGLATSFGVTITTAQHTAILTFCGAVALVAPLVGAILDHSNKQVVARQVAAATIAGTTPAAPATSQAAEDIQAQVDALGAE